MNAQGQTVCLSMIVKNEATVIRRCMESVRPIIDYWIIVDTGSTDGTQDVIREHLKDLPGELGECQDSCRPAFVTRVALSTSGFWHVRQA